MNSVSAASATRQYDVGNGQHEDLGSIAKGKYADFFLVPGDPTASLSQLRQIRMVVADGTFYFPAEVYPWFGVRPATTPPSIVTGE